MTDLGVAQSPMFGETPGPFAWLLPGFGPLRLLYEGAFSSSFHDGVGLALSLGWLATISGAVYLVLRRAAGTSDA